ncbi:hypothetical protein KGY79_08550 [Candidatus Bipolaricaulota bacterium]|nr:hypothetical protein [Candidatus Bipolaricaulota bacterium]
MQGKIAKPALLMAASLLLLGFTLVPVFAASPTYGFRVRLTTTSDWTRVLFKGASSALFKDRILKTSGAKDLKVRASNDLFVNKASFDESEVVVDYEVYLGDVGTVGPKAFITKGDVGSTKLQFYRLDEDDSPFLTLANSGRVEGDTENEKQSLIPKSMLPEVNLADKGKLDVDKKVLAFYYPWYGSPEGPTGKWNHWNPNESFASTNVPKAGYYDSKSEETIRRHIRQAKQNGIDGFIVSWWGPYSFSDQTLKKFMEISEEMDFQFSIYFEKASSKRDMVRQLSCVFDNYTGSESFLRVIGKPVIFCYGRVTHQYDPSVWQEVFSELEKKGHSGFFIGDGLSSDILSAFDGLHTYNPVNTPLDELTDDYESASFQAEVRDKLFAATVVPGYDDTVIRDPGMVKERNGGDLYRKFWEIARNSQPDWILITSFNEWHEGTEIEQSEEYGAEYLTLTRDFAEEWKEN